LRTLLIRLVPLPEPHDAFLGAFVSGKGGGTLCVFGAGRLAADKVKGALDCGRNRWGSGKMISCKQKKKCKK